MARRCVDGQGVTEVIALSLASARRHVCVTSAAKQALAKWNVDKTKQPNAMPYRILTFIKRLSQGYLFASDIV